MRLSFWRQIALFSIFFFISPYFLPVSAKTPVIIINQIRGTSACCEPGSVDMIKEINSHEDLSQLSLAWALRYDAIRDKDCTQALSNLPQNQSLGILLEVIPSLAKDSEVAYQEDLAGVDWNRGMHAFLIGYTKDERKKLIDTSFASFYKSFSYYPTFTASWMIDSWSLNYLRTAYGIRVHEITKEQYETDGYTLYGGVFNLPFYPSRYHPLIPASSNSSALDMLIFRQTISDFEKNYGSYQSYYTSQPNDYLSHPKGNSIDYFKQLLSSVDQQREEEQFAVLGLENSTEWQVYKAEYLHQLEIVYQKMQAGEYQALTPHEYYLTQKRSDYSSSIRVLKDSSFPEKGVLWVFGPSYRARLEIWDNKLMLTDLRVYSKLIDPYRDNPAQTSQAYWIVPYLLDSSQQFMAKDNDSEFTGEPIRSDLHVQRFGIELLSTSPLLLDIEGNEFLTISAKDSYVTLTPTQIQILHDEPKFSMPINISFDELLKLNTDQYFTFDRHPRFFLSPEKKANQVVLGWENSHQDNIVIAELLKKDDTWIITPNTSLNQSEVDDLASIFQPDRSKLGIDPTKSTFYWHNVEAIAGRSPVRLYVDARNGLSRSVKISTFRSNIMGSEDVRVIKPDTSKMLQPFLIDYEASKSATAKVNLIADGNIIAGETQVRFYSDCTKNLKYCLTNKEELLGFIKVVIRDKGQQYKSSMSQLLNNWQRRFAQQLKSWKSDNDD